ncbi:class I tRNA ligase family protein, partial [Staphylococcus pettenkoferi]|uniref:class I tRNA ligase family protein n=1 Tax=Staphylococcus pettenkoferi TaxID=170573 RepID=UPI0021B4DD7A
MPHPFNNILKHIITPYNTIQPYYTPYLPPSDTHPLPIQQPFTKKPLKRKQISLSQFRHKSRQFALNQIQLQKKHFRPL